MPRRGFAGALLDFLPQGIALGERARENRLADALREAQLYELGVRTGPLPTAPQTVDLPSFDVDPATGRLTRTGSTPFTILGPEGRGLVDTERYRPLSEGRYLDVAETPAARAERTAQAEAEASFARALALEAARERAAEERDRRLYGTVTTDPTTGEPTFTPGAQTFSTNARDLFTRTYQTQTLAERQRHNRAMEDAARTARAATATNQQAARATPTTGERNAAALLPEAIDAAGVLKELDNPGALSTLVTQRPVLGIVGNYWQTPYGRRFHQAAVQFINAVIVAKSGKAITQKEAERYFQQYIPMPGDDEDTLARKRRARELGLEAIRIAAGRAAPLAEGGQARTASPARYSPDNPFVKP